MSICQQAIRRRRQSRQDKRYNTQRLKSADASVRRLRQRIATEQRMKVKK